MNVTLLVEEAISFQGKKLASLLSDFDLLRNVRRMTLFELQDLTEGMTMPNVEEAAPVPTFTPGFGSWRGAFDITQHVSIRRRDRRNMWAQCPSCSKGGKDRGRDNLAIATADPRKYKCWAGCTRDDIRAACGYGPAKRF